MPIDNMFAAICVIFLLTCSAVLTTPVEEKPLNCPPNEVYYKCNLEVCWKSCAHLVNPPPCPSLSADCYQPACECAPGLLRRSADDTTCVPSAQCPKDLQ